MAINKTHMTRKEASEYTGFSQCTFAKWAVVGYGPKFTKIGTGRSSRVRYPIAELDQFLNGGPVGDGGQASNSTAGRKFA